MLKEESYDNGSGEKSRARACDTCRSAACTVYCRADSAYLCTSCDAQVHSANRVASRHKRVRVCESCERSPATFLCEADDASLCTACDSEVHSANPLARRHHRVPILPISGNCYNSMPTHHQTEATRTEQEENRVLVVEGEDRDEDDRNVHSWLLPKNTNNNNNHNNNNNNNNNHNDGFLFGDENLNFVDYNSSMDYKFTGQYNQQDCGVPQTSYGGDRVVPLRVEELRSHPHHKQQKFEFDLPYGYSASHYNYNSSLNHNAYMETSVVPEPTARDTTIPHQRDQVPAPAQMITQLSPMDREARVLRYREKKKTRKFDKTIRYASRKAYAEIRPRINGRFAKRRETEAEADQAFNTMLMSETGYGIVPSF